MNVLRWGRRLLVLAIMSTMMGGLVALPAFASTAEQSGYGWVDFNADARADRCMLTDGNRLHCTLSSGTGFNVHATSGAVDPGYAAGRAWADFNGDSRADYCRVVGSWHKMLSCTTSTGGSFGQTFTSGSLDPGYDSGRAWVDFSGDGRADYCRVVGGWDKKLQCTESIGDGFGSTRTSTVVDPGYDAGRAWVDFTGDGRADYCRVVGGWDKKLQCTVHQSGGFGTTFTSAVVDPGYDAGRAWVDVNGDRRADYCRMVGWGDRSQCTLSTGSGFGATFTSTSMDTGYDNGRHWAHVNVDSRADFCREMDGPRVKCTLSTGTGFGTTWTHSPSSSNEAVLGTSRFADFNGDGKADYCRHTKGGWLACTVSTGSGFGSTFTGAPW